MPPNNCCRTSCLLLLQSWTSAACFTSALFASFGIWCVDVFLLDNAGLNTTDSTQQVHARLREDCTFPREWLWKSWPWLKGLKFKKTQVKTKPTNAIYCTKCILFGCFFVNRGGRHGKAIFSNWVTMRPLEAVGSSLSNWASTMLWAQLCKTIAFFSGRGQLNDSEIVVTL